MTQNEPVYNPFSSYFQHYTVNRTESNEKDSFNMRLNFSSFKNFALLYSRVGAGVASKFLSEPHKNDAPPKHCH
jgi:hypothetical protein